MHTHEVVSVSQTKFLTPAAFVFLYENNLFLTFRERQVAVWNFRGEQVSAMMMGSPAISTNALDSR